MSPRFLTILFSAITVLNLVPFCPDTNGTSQTRPGLDTSDNLAADIESIDDLKASFQVKPPYIHINKFKKKKGTNVIVLRTYVCAKAPKNGQATSRDCTPSAKDKNLGNVTSIEVTTKDKFGKTVYSKIKNFNKLDYRYGGTQDLEFATSYLERNSEYVVSVTVVTRKGDVSHKDVSLTTPR